VDSRRNRTPTRIARAPRSLVPRFPARFSEFHVFSGRPMIANLHVRASSGPGEVLEGARRCRFEVALNASEGSRRWP
jgi:hypothetical protein